MMFAVLTVAAGQAEPCDIKIFGHSADAAAFFKARVEPCLDGDFDKLYAVEVDAADTRAAWRILQEGDETRRRILATTEARRIAAARMRAEADARFGNLLLI
jgi:hypothetical protein